MLKMNREKRESSDKHGGRAINSVLKYSTVSRNDAMEFEEVLTMNHEGSSAGVDDDGERPDFRYVAWLLREKLNDIVDGDQGEPPELQLRSLLDMVASRKIISVDPKLLNPLLWRTLPQELLLLVLVHLPVPDITRLRSLSKKWNRDMATMNSEINRALDETRPTMVAVFSWSYGDSIRELLVTICTQRVQYSYRFHPENPIIHEDQWNDMGNPLIFEDRWHDMGAVSGGLVCFVSTWKTNKANPLCIIVVNLLTGVRRKLPPLQYVYLTPPRMMHIEVDSQTMCYRVVMVGKIIKGRPTVEMYNSGARQWTKATPPLGSIFGLAHSWEYNLFSTSFKCTSATESMYDFAEGQLKHLDLMGPSQGASVMTYELQKDCMFVLHRNSCNGDILPAEGHCITKYCIQNNAKDWVQEGSYLCSPFEELSEKDWDSMFLEACEGFVMVFSDSLDNCGNFWLLDLSTREWRSLPNCFKRHESRITMYQAFWNVVP